MKQNRYLYVVRVRFEDNSDSAWDEEFERSELSRCLHTRSSASAVARRCTKACLDDSWLRCRFEVWRISYAKSKYEQDRKYTLLEVWRNYPLEY